MQAFVSWNSLGSCTLFAGVDKETHPGCWLSGEVQLHLSSFDEGYEKADVVGKVEVIY